MKKILVIHTGGTISMMEDSVTGAVVETEKNPLSGAIFQNSSDLEIVTIEPFQLPSPHITPVEMLQLRNIIESAIRKTGIKGVVITHGTDTLEETAYFLDLTVSSDIPIVLTGAMRSSNELGADGPANFLTAVKVATSDDAIGKGVLVVMNDEIHSAKNVTKTHTSNLSTFQSPQYGPVGTITKRGVFFHHQPLITEKFQVNEVNKLVAIVKAFAGLTSDIFYALAAQKIDGLIIEALGQGNMPPQSLAGIEALLAQNIPIVLVSRCFNGTVDAVYAYEGGGYDLKKRGMIFSNGLNAQKARIKLLLALCQTNRVVDIQKAFE